MTEYKSKPVEKVKMFGRWVGILLLVVVLVFIVILFAGLLNMGGEDGPGLFRILGFSLIIVWSCIFVCYFIWATNFYNMNYGVTRKFWERNKKAKQSMAEGKTYNPEDIEDEPVYNPYKDETFGLPSGTVRGMIAFTLLFGAIGLLIVSFGMDNTIDPNSFFYDQFEFFKKAFLMMVAFYFGTRSLKYFEKNKPVNLNTKRANIPKSESVNANGGTDSKTVSGNRSARKTKSEVVVVDSSDPTGEKTKEHANLPIKPVDPMQPKS